MTENRAHIASSLLDFDPVLKPAVDYVFGSFFISDDAETARKIAFDYSRITCITMSGDKYQPGGVLEGGGSNKKGDLLLEIRKMREL
jgi:structural maintenance of chromosome 2